MFTEEGHAYLVTSTFGSFLSVKFTLWIVKFTTCLLTVKICRKYTRVWWLISLKWKIKTKIILFKISILLHYLERNGRYNVVCSIIPLAFDMEFKAIGILHLIQYIKGDLFGWLLFTLGFWQRRMKPSYCYICLCTHNILFGLVLSNSLDSFRLSNIHLSTHPSIDLHVKCIFVFIRQNGTHFQFRFLFVLTL